MSATTPEQARRSAEHLLSDVQAALRQINTLIYASDHIFSQMSGIHDDQLRSLIDHADSLFQISAGLTINALTAAERLEMALHDRGGRPSA